MNKNNWLTGISILIIGLLFLFGSCKQYEAENLTGVKIDLSDPAFQRLIGHKDRHNTDSLQLFLSSSNAIYRYYAALSIGSIQDSSLVDALTPLLKDDVVEVRAAAAFSLGQIRSGQAEQALIDAYERFDTGMVYATANRAILEAVGKCGGDSSLMLLSTTSTLLKDDTLLLEGVALGIYQFGMRGLRSPKSIEKMLQLATDKQFPPSVRLIAANYFTRDTSFKIDSVQAPLLSTAISAEKNPDIRMALVLGLGKSRCLEAQNSLLDFFQSEKDYRVKCNIIRALAGFDYLAVQPAMMAALKDENVHVSNRAAQYFVDNGMPSEATRYWRLAKDTIHWRSQMRLYQATHKYLPSYYAQYREPINYELKKRFETSTSPYEKAAALKAMAGYGWNFRYIHKMASESSMPQVRTAGFEALNEILDRDNFEPYFGLGHRKVTAEIAYNLKAALLSGDLGSAATAAIGLRNEKRNILPLFGGVDSLSFLDEALAKYSDPKAIETYNEIIDTKKFLTGDSTLGKKTVGYNHPINWKIISGLSIEPEAIIKTTRGVIRVKLLPAIAPGSVANFIDLSKSDYYKDKFFHRVEHNFVVQTGCSRGDGYGGLNYTIRSEFSPVSYNHEGYVGMASAGKDTEGTQFFITHSPTLHLDGKYTIFGRVLEGMDVVHKLEIGDRIQDIVIQ